MMEAREKNGLDVKRCVPAVVVPMGADLSRIQVPDQPVPPRRLVYMGHLRENQGLELCAEVFSELRREFTDLTWEIVGEGWKRPDIEQQLKRSGVSDGVTWHGFLPDHREVENILCRGGIGLALYEPSPETFTTFADPGKPKVYLACGLPVLITSVPAVAGEIEKEGAGAVIPYRKEAAVTVLAGWLRDPVKISTMRRSALRLARKYDWPSIFERTLKATFTGSLPETP
jgi:glycosyltransferase involved in cell wall biosynthesis